ncbi:hypothetical protein C8R45DRAFT_1103914 [Mycena sanguinolenta]|nr:hypothetical protein C8R45DRAFT_1103914 [Mycena sanguinolenta]
MVDPPILSSTATASTREGRRSIRPPNFTAAQPEGVAASCHCRAVVTEVHRTQPLPRPHPSRVKIEVAPPPSILSVPAPAPAGYEDSRRMVRSGERDHAHRTIGTQAPGLPLAPAALAIHVGEPFPLHQEHVPTSPRDIRKSPPAPATGADCASRSTILLAPVLRTNIGRRVDWTAADTPTLCTRPVPVVHTRQAPLLLPDFHSAMDEVHEYTLLSPSASGRHSAGGAESAFSSVYPAAVPSRHVHKQDRTVTVTETATPHPHTRLHPHSQRDATKNRLLLRPQAPTPHPPAATKDGGGMRLHRSPPPQPSLSHTTGVPPARERISSAYRMTMSQGKDTAIPCILHSSHCSGASAACACTDSPHPWSSDFSRPRSSVGDAIWRARYRGVPQLHRPRMCQLAEGAVVA